MKICQSCTMPLTNEKSHGTEADGTTSEDYCHHCFKDGEFVDDMTMEEMIVRCIPFYAHRMDAEKARIHLINTLPTLKRWLVQ